MDPSNRPINLDLTKFAFPVPAIASIIHRITGVVLFGGVAFLLYLLDLSTDSELGYVAAQAWLAAPLGKLIIWAVLAALAYHFVAGIKHLIMDFGIGETLEGGRQGAWITLLGSAMLIAAIGAWIW